MRLVIAKTPRIGSTDTFVNAHIQGLRNVVGTLELDRGNIFWNDCVLPRPGIALRAIRAANRRLRRISWDQQFDYDIAKLLNANCVDVLLAEYGPTGVALLPACRRAGVPMVVHFHGYDASRHKILEWYENEYRALWGSAAIVVVVSHAMRDALVRLGCPESKIILNVYGVEVSQRNETISERIGSSTFLAVGRFVEKKAPYLTIIAFKYCLDSFPDARLRLVGEGPLLGPCVDIAKALGIDHAVQFTGAKSHSDVLHEMQSAFCFVQHSVTASSGDSEGTPVAILEACAAGLPIIATRHAGIPDVVEHGTTGMLVDERDVHGMANAMRELLQNRSRAIEMGAAAQEVVRSRLTMDQSLSRLQSIIGAVGGGTIGSEIDTLQKHIENRLFPAR